MNEKDIKVTITDELDGPGSGGLRGNGRIWYKVGSEPWKVSHFRSAYKCGEAIEQAANVEEAIEAIKDYET